MVRRSWHVITTSPLLITLLMAGCGGGGSSDLGSISDPCSIKNSSTLISAPVTAIAAAARVSFAIRDDKTLWAWGTSTTGQLGAAGTTTSPIPIKIGDDFTAISASFGHSLALKSNGTLWAWGDNSFGQLGNGNTTDSDVPIQIGSANDYIAVSAGYLFSLALKSDGTLWAWGDNQAGELGIGNASYNNCVASPTPHCTAPVQVGSDYTYTAISAGYFFSLALKSDNSLWAWGNNSYGELGNNTTTDSNVPIQIDNGSVYGAIAAGYFYSLGIKLDGSLMRWGNNTQGKPGNPAVTDHLPKQIGSGFSPVVEALSASKFSVLGNTSVYYHSLALKSDGSLWAWGDNFFGQLGNGSLSSADLPEQILADSGFAFTAVSAGDDDHSLAIRNDGSLWAWGNNGSGALGNGFNTGLCNIPIQISK